MNSTSKQVLTVTAIAFCLLCGAFAIWFLVMMYFPYGGKVASGVTAKRVQLVRIGMMPQEVEALLGKPFSVSSYKGSACHVLGCKNSGETTKSIDVTGATNLEGFFQEIAADTTVHACDVNDERKHDRHTTFTYSRHGGFMTRYPMLWVHFDKQARVDNVYAKDYAVDDVCIYSLSDDKNQYTNNQAALEELFGN